jgi:hypothetical protein
MPQPASFSSHRYDARAFGPRLFFRDDVPESELEPVEPGSQLSGGIVALFDAEDQGISRSLGFKIGLRTF